jgi:hypothetical protein
LIRTLGVEINEIIKRSLCVKHHGMKRSRCDASDVDGNVTDGSDPECVG